MRQLPDGRFEVPSPRLAKAGRELMALGVPVERSIDFTADVRKQADQLAQTYVDLFLETVWTPFESLGSPPEGWPAVQEALDRMLPLASDSLLAIFGMAMKDAVERESARALQRMADRAEGKDVPAHSAAAGDTAGGDVDCELPTLRGERVVLRPLAAGDVDVLADVICEPEVARWWDRPTTASSTAAACSRTSRERGAFAIEVGGELAGWLGVHEETEPHYRHGSLDIFLAPARHGAGLGPEALRLAARWLIEERGHHRLTIDPAAANERAIGVYASIGFRPVGVMRGYERGADGEWHDGLLMDMLAHELR